MKKPKKIEEVKKREELSVLIPVYDCMCTDLVSSLHSMLEESGIRYEIIVADDCSPDKEYIELNRPIEELSNVRYIVREKNSGRAAIRNFLASEAQYKWLLFIDGDVMVDRVRFITKYLERGGDVLIGGISIYKRDRATKNNLRFLYEMHTMKHRRAWWNVGGKHVKFRTTNFLIAKHIVEEHPFNEAFKRYGYEDVLFGKKLEEAGIQIRYTNNPVVITDFEDNAKFMEKTEEALQTLHDFKKELRGFSAIPMFTIFKPVLLPAYYIFGKLIRKNLVSNKPKVALYQLYRVLYYCHL